MSGEIILTPLARTSPTLWSHMRLCGLRGAFASSRAADRWVLHDPRAWLGTAFHKVMEASRRPSATAATPEETWTAAVRVAADAAAHHMLDARFAAPDRWPGYFLARQRALASAQHVIAANVDGARPSAAHQQGASATERSLQARRGRLVGRPDRFDGRVLTEYKSSMPDPAWHGAEAVREGFRRQLRLYAAIIAEATGRWPRRPAQPWLPSMILILALRQVPLPKPSHGRGKTAAADARSRSFVRHSGLGCKQQARAAFPTLRLQPCLTG